MIAPQQKVQFVDFDKKPLARVLDLRRANFIALDDSERGFFRQADYIDAYVRDREIACQGLIVEEHYIDRDHMEDHSVFYSSSLHAYENWCKRVHFFNVGAAALRGHFENILDIARKGDLSAYRHECARLSREHYLGFAVIKPLSGSPIGRTVIRTFGPEKEDKTLRSFLCTRRYTTHLLGAQLSVVGLAFQQQDLGVSACATTALWSSLQTLRDPNEIGGIVPAQITKLASQYALPFGRPMPSEGLSVDQMCMAVQSLGLAPNLLKTDEYATGRGLLYSVTCSGFASVLILERTDGAHAVAVAGMKLRPSRPRDSFIGEASAFIDDQASDLLAVYVHDDRYGPYLRADLKKQGNNLFLEIDATRDRTHVELWKLTHILVPGHSKIRLSLSALRIIALRLCVAVNRFRAAKSGVVVASKAGSAITNPEFTIVFKTTVERNYEYTEKLISNDGGPAKAEVDKFLSTVILSRYIGLISLQAEYLGQVDVLVDTTSTQSNLHFSAVVIARKGEYADLVARHLSHECQTPFFG